MSNHIMSTDEIKQFLTSNTFIPHEKGANQKFFSQTPVTILQKEKINSVYEYMFPDKLVEAPPNK